MKKKGWRWYAPAPSFYHFLVLVSLLFVPPIFAQNDRGSYLIPQIVYVGDRGSLVVPLGSSVRDSSPIPLPESTETLVIHRVFLERRGENMQLVIEFTAYITGVLDLPEIPLPGFSERDNPAAGLQVTIASILDSSLVLSPSSPPIAVPGTSFIIYGTAIGIILLLLLFLGGQMFWTQRFGALRQRLVRKRLAKRMRNCISRLRKSGGAGVPDTLALELRTFLSRFLNINCMVMTAGEFPLLQDRLPPAPYDGIFLQNIFRHWDSLRFAGPPVDETYFNEEYFHKTPEPKIRLDGVLIEEARLRDFEEAVLKDTMLDKVSAFVDALAAELPDGNAETSRQGG